MTAAAPVRVRIARVDGCEDLPLPRAQSEGAAGLDLYAAVDGETVIEPGDRAVVHTGIAIALPAGTEGQVRPRSGIAFDAGVTVLNTPGTIDSDYRGEVKVLLVNLGPMPFTVTRGMRVAQLVVAPVLKVELDEVQSLPPSARGSGGFGSTGTEQS